MLKPAKPEAYKLLHDGVVALARVEANGIRLDVDYLHRTKEKVGKRIKKMQAQLRADDVYRQWSRTFGSKTNLGSRPQLATILYDVMGFEIKHRTKRDKPSTNAAALELISMEIPFVKHLLRVEKYKKLHSTYLTGLIRESCDGLLHPFFDLHKARTYRSASSNPNFQNLPIRDDELAELVRQAFIPREGGHLVEIDFSGVEVRIAACYNKDPNLVADILDPARDMHRDMAAACFMLDPSEVTKLMRYCGKNKFVFPQFYGSYFAQCAPSLWDGIEHFGFTVGDISLFEHLKQQGIRKLGDCTGKPKAGTFENHVKGVEKQFWDERFVVYRDWKKRWYKKYLRNAGFTTLTGFRCEGLMKRNDVSNYPIQGSAFHCLLACLIELQKRMRKRKMRSLLVGQIHDSVVADVPGEELDDFIELAVWVMTKWLRKHYKWITVPIEVEAEVAPLDGNWFQKKEITL